MAQSNRRNVIPRQAKGQDVPDRRALDRELRQLATDLHTRIESGEFAPGRAVPSRKQLEQEYEVGQKTAEHALRYLADEGIIEPVRGKGNYVLGPSKGKN